MIGLSFLKLLGLKLLNPKGFRFILGKKFINIRFKLSEGIHLIDIQIDEDLN